MTTVRSLPERTLLVARRLPRLAPALALSALGTVMTLRAHVGVAPWTVFHDGLHHVAPLTFGQAVIVTGLALVAAARIAGIRPGVGTLINIVAVGLVDDALLGTGVGASLVSGSVVWRALLLLAGLAATGLGSALYVGAGLGAGPRDSMQLAISRQLRLRPGTARFTTEALAVGAGLAMGGNLSWGTAVAVVVIPPVVDTGFRLLRLDREGRPSIPAQQPRRDSGGTVPHASHRAGIRKGLVLLGMDVTPTSHACLVAPHARPCALESDQRLQFRHVPRWPARFVRTGGPGQLVRQHDRELHAGAGDTRPACQRGDLLR